MVVARHCHALVQSCVTLFAAAYLNIYDEFQYIVQHLVDMSFFLRD